MFIDRIKLRGFKPF